MKRLIFLAMVFAFVGATSLEAALVGTGDKRCRNCKTTQDDGTGEHDQLIHGAVTVAGMGGSETQKVTVAASVSHDGLRVVVGASATQVVAANADRKSCLICNVFTDKVAVGPSDVTINSNDATDGKVLPGAKAAGDGTGSCIVYTTTAAIFAIGDSASSKVSVTVEDY